MAFYLFRKTHTHNWFHILLFARNEKKFNFQYEKATVYRLFILSINNRAVLFYLLNFCYHVDVLEKGVTSWHVPTKLRRNWFWSIKGKYHTTDECTLMDSFCECKEQPCMQRLMWWMGKETATATAHDNGKFFVFTDDDCWYLEMFTPDGWISSSSFGW